MYLAFGVGLCLGSILAGQVSDWMLQHLRSKSNGQVVPEMRLRAAIPSFLLIPAGYLIYGWTLEYGIGVYAPIIGLFVCKCLVCVTWHLHECVSSSMVLDAFGQMSAFTPANVYLVDSQPGRSATAIGVNNCARSIAGAIMAIFSTQAVHSLGPGILFSVLAAINVLNIALVIICMLFGQRWRQNLASKQAQQESEIQKQKVVDIHRDEEDHHQHRQVALEHSLARTASRHSTI